MSTTLSPVVHQTIEIDGIEIFYREAGRQMPLRSSCPTAIHVRHSSFGISCPR
jgi:hypothetical protein